MLSAVGLPAKFITARAYKKQLLTIRLLIKFTKRKGYDPAYALTGLHTRLSIKKTLKQQALILIKKTYMKLIKSTRHGVCNQLTSVAVRLQRQKIQIFYR